MDIKEVYCIEDFVEDGTVYWGKGCYYEVIGYDAQLGGFRIKHEYGEGFIYDEDFDGYFEVTQN